jgi:flagellar basal body-associated protein FliL
VIDFSVIASNRFTKKYLAKHEFELRDYLISHFESIDGAFAMTEEGREVIRQKLEVEINNFLVDYKVEGQVSEVRIIYILSH